MDQRRLQEMLDHYEITRTLAEYCHACDRCDEVQMAEVYCEDSWDNHGNVKASGRDFSRIITERALNNTQTLSHLLGQSMIKVDGDEAGAETYFIVVMETGGDERVSNQMGGRYVDRLERVDGRWLIKHRVVVQDWSISIPVEQDWWTNSGMVKGQRSSDDVSYGVLGLVHGSSRPG